MIVCVSPYACTALVSTLVPWMVSVAHLCWCAGRNTPPCLTLHCYCLSAGIKTLKEVDLAFIPYESKVFSLDSPRSLSDFHTAGNLEQMADHLVTVCSMLEEYPHVRYRR